MFKKASLKLASIYLAIIMVISLAFSISLYNVSVRVLDRGLLRQRDVITNGLRFQNMIFDPSQIFIDHSVELNEAKNRVINNLIIINLFILVSGGVLSYYLARRSLKPIEEAHEAQSRFTADASHELRTPIAAMQTEIEVALMKPDLNIQEAKAQLKSNLEELAKLTSISEGLLKISKLENNNLDKSEVSINAVIDAAIGRVISDANKKEVKFQTKVANELKIMGDYASLEEAIVTILDNAVKYSPNSSTIEVKAAQVANHIEIKIKDHGIGISQTDIPHIFDRFYRVDTARCKTDDCGYGLGLAIAHNIIDLHDGTIEVKSLPSKGSTFIIKLPL